MPCAESVYTSAAGVYPTTTPAHRAGGCRRILDPRGGPGVCNADNQQNCFYPAKFDCKCIPKSSDRHIVCVNALKRCTCDAAEFQAAVDAEVTERDEERQKKKTEKAAAKKSAGVCAQMPCPLLAY